MFDVFATHNGRGAAGCAPTQMTPLTFVLHALRPVLRQAQDGVTKLTTIILSLSKDILSLSLP